MARPITFGENESSRLARAGAYTLNKIEDDVREDARYQEARAHQLKQESLAEERNARAEGREERMTKSQELEDEIKRWDFEKKKALDANAARMKIETDKQAIEANEALFKINTETEDAPLKLAEWGAKYFRVLDEKTGDPRLIRQFQINQGRADSARTAREKLAEEQKKATALKGEGFTPSSATIGGVTYKAPGSETDDMKVLERERKFYQDNLARAEARRNAAKDDDTKKLFDEDIREYKAKRDEAESQLRSFREGKAQPAAAAEAPAGPVKVASADDFAKLPSGAEFIDPQGIKRRKP